MTQPPHLRRTFLGDLETVPQETRASLDGDRDRLAALDELHTLGRLSFSASPEVGGDTVDVGNRRQLIGERHRQPQRERRLARLGHPLLLSRSNLASAASQAVSHRSSSVLH